MKIYTLKNINYCINVINNLDFFLKTVLFFDVKINAKNLNLFLKLKFEIFFD